MEAGQTKNKWKDQQNTCLPNIVFGGRGAGWDTVTRKGWDNKLKLCLLPGGSIFDNVTIFCLLARSRTRKENQKRQQPYIYICISLTHSLTHSLTAERSGAERSGTERNGTDRTGPDRTGAKRSEAERSGAERSGARRCGPDRRGADEAERSVSVGPSNDHHQRLTRHWVLGERFSAPEAIF